MLDVHARAEHFYIGGEWVAPSGAARRSVVNPATGLPFTTVPLGNERDADRAVAAAREAFEPFSRTTIGERCALIEAFGRAFDRYREEMAQLLVAELGAPVDLARAGHCTVVDAHVADFLHAARTRSVNEVFDPNTRVLREPVGVCALITPWNWPPNQIALKVLAALAAGCTMVLKPSEVTPLNAVLFAQVMDEAAIPPGVFNMIQGDGATIGTHLARHPQVDMISFYPGGAGCLCECRRNDQADRSGAGRKVRADRLCKRQSSRSRAPGCGSLL
jgi:aldehyde dehydrogenase (NAD+)